MMNKYRDKSDFEINKAVAININGTDAVLEKFGSIYISDSDAMVSFGPCNNPYDAMPIIIENRIAICPIFSSDWCATSDCDAYRVINKNPLRAAMEVFLMMKEAENEKS
ncbi:TPA: phage protein NinX family protein [Morganella morganii]